MAAQGMTLQPKVMLLGPDGQLGRAIRAEPCEGLDVIPVPRSKLDLADIPSIRVAVDDIRPDLVLNTAAFTDVDRAEVEQDLAMAINARAVEALARAAKGVGAAFLHISSDLVFDGGTDQPYTETDHCAPLNMYGATKLLGDELAQLACPRTAIFRTSELHAPWGRNALRQVLLAALEGREVEAAQDRIISPTSVHFLARACLGAARDLVNADAYADVWGLTNCAGFGACSELDLMRDALDLAGENPGIVRAQAMVDWPSAAARPKMTALDSRRLTRVFGIQPRPWQVQLTDSIPAPAPKQAHEAA